MQISSLINNTNEDPLDEPKILIRFAPYINTDACPTSDEITNYLNRTARLHAATMVLAYLSSIVIYFWRYPSDPIDIWTLIA